MNVCCWRCSGARVVYAPKGLWRAEARTGTALQVFLAFLPLFRSPPPKETTSKARKLATFSPWNRSKLLLLFLQSKHLSVVRARAHSAVAATNFLWHFRIAWLFHCWPTFRHIFADIDASRTENERTTERRHWKNCGCNAQAVKNKLIEKLVWTQFGLNPLIIGCRRSVDRRHRYFFCSLLFYSLGLIKMFDIG